MPIIEIAKIQVRRGQENIGPVPQLAPGELAWAEDTQNLYIGKRISEGANSDNNSRILTDKDLTNIFSSALGTVSAINTSTAYRFKNYIPWGALGSTGTTYATTTTYLTKLDNWVSLTDFAPDGIWPPTGYSVDALYDATTGNKTINITKILQKAIGEFSAANLGGGVVLQNGTLDAPAVHSGNPTPNTLGPMAIKIPAGTWVVNGPISLPPFTTLVGEGAGMTTLIWANAATTATMFQTVDSLGVSYNGYVDSGSQQYYMAVANGQNARNVTLKGMSLTVPPGRVSLGATSGSLISLDNASNVLFDNVYFGNLNTASNVNNIVGINIRTSGPAVSDITMAYSDNIQVNNCWFNGMTTGIYNTGTVNRVIVKDSKFTWLYDGIISTSYVNDSTTYLNNGLALNNRFENISNPAITIGNTSVTKYTQFISQNNSFRNVGCSFLGDVNYQRTNVLCFNDVGGHSINDYFDRQDLLFQKKSTSTSQIHWVSPKTSVKASGVHKRNVAWPRIVDATTSNTTTFLLSLPLSTGQSMAKIDYILTNRNMSRKGQLLMNMSNSGTVEIPDGFASVSDYYNYFEEPGSPDANQALRFSTDMTHAAPTIQLNSAYVYVLGAIGADFTLTQSTINVSFDTQRTGFTSTIFSNNVTQVTLDASNVVKVFGTSNTATLSAFTLTGPKMTATLNKPLQHLDTGTQVIFTNPSSIITWSSSTGAYFDYPLRTDPAVASFTDQVISSAVIRIDDGMSPTKIYPITSITPLNTGTSSSTYRLSFTPTTTFRLEPTTKVSAWLTPGEFYNYVTLTCNNADISLSTWTNFECTIDLLT